MSNLNLTVAECSLLIEFLKFVFSHNHAQKNTILEIVRDSMSMKSLLSKLKLSLEQSSKNPYSSESKAEILFISSVSADISNQETQLLSKTVKNNQEFNEVVIKEAAQFLHYFCLVFDWDWDYTKYMLSADDCEESSVNGNIPFVCPEIYQDNWANRGGLIASYLRLKALLEEKGISISLENF